MVAPGPSVLEALHDLVAFDLLPEEARPSVEALHGGVSVERVGSALDALRACGAEEAFDKVTKALGRDHGEIVVAAALPGARFAEDLDVRTSRPRRFQRNWHGDLLIAPSSSWRGASVIVGSRRGAEAIAGLERGVRAAIVALDVLSAVGDDLAGLPAVWLDGVRSLTLPETSGSTAAALIRRCPALEEYLPHSTASREETDALVCAKRLRCLAFWDPQDDDLARVAVLPCLVELDLSRHSSPGFGAAGLAELARASTLRRLRLWSPSIDDAEIAAIAGIASLEELDLSGSRSLTEGIRALGALRSLRRLVLSSDVSHEITAVARATFAEGVVWHRSDD